MLIKWSLLLLLLWLLILIGKCNSPLTLREKSFFHQTFRFLKDHEKIGWGIQATSVDNGVRAEE